MRGGVAINEMSPCSFCLLDSMSISALASTEASCFSLSSFDCLFLSMKYGLVAFTRRLQALPLVSMKADKEPNAVNADDVVESLRTARLSMDNFCLDLHRSFLELDSVLVLFLFCFLDRSSDGQVCGWSYLLSSGADILMLVDRLGVNFASSHAVDETS